MTGNGSKLKGKDYERHVSNLINKYFKGAESRRTPNSGAMQDRFPGDIMDLPNQLQAFSIECKKQETARIWQWIKQAEHGASIVNKIPMVVFSRNRSKDYVLLSFEDFLILMGGDTYESNNVT